MLVVKALAKHCFLLSTWVLIAQVPKLANQILQGKIRGRVVIDVND